MLIKRNSTVRLKHNACLLHPIEIACPFALFVQHRESLICR